MKHAGNARFLPRRAAGRGSRGSTSPAVPTLTGSTFHPQTAAPAAQDRIQQGLGCRALRIICIIFSDSLSFACLLSRQHSRGSHRDEPVAERAEGVLHLTRFCSCLCTLLSEIPPRNDSSCPQPLLIQPKCTGTSLGSSL